MKTKQPTELQQYVKRHENTCVYYNGLCSQVCRADVPYDLVKCPMPAPEFQSIEQRASGRTFQIPCRKDPPGAYVNSCPKAKFLSRAEALIEAKKDLVATRRTLCALALVMQHAGKISKGQGAMSGEIKCPNCKNGRLRYSIASNGHCWGSCTTKGCTSWVQ